MQFIIPLLVLAILATLAYEDWKHMGITVHHSRLATISFGVLFVIQLATNSQYAFFQLILGVIIIAVLWVPMSWTLARMDKEIVFLSLICAAIPSVIALGFYFGYHSIRASWYRHYKTASSPFPALTHYAVAFAVAIILMAI